MRLVLLTAILLLPGIVCAQESGGPSSPKARKSFETGTEWVQQRNYAAAIDEFRKADKQDGYHCEACAKRIIQYGEQIGDFKAADVAAQQLIADAKTPGEIAIAHLMRATVQLREGLIRDKQESFAEADREFQLSLAANPNDPPAEYFDGLSLARMRQDDAAKARFRKFLTVAAKDDVNRLRAQRYLDNPELTRARMAPPFSVTTLRGNQVSLDGLAGKVVLIDFWATWCGPCREALPHIRQIAAEFSGEPLVVMSISVDKNESKWKDFVAKNDMSWLQYRDADGGIAKSFGVDVIPHTFTIDADGVLQDEHIGDGSIERKLKKLCAQARRQQEAPATSLPTAAN